MDIFTRLFRNALFLCNALKSPGNLEHFSQKGRQMEETQLLKKGVKSVLSRIILGHLIIPSFII